MNHNYYGKNNFNRPIYRNNDDRFIGGGFLGPFILGGITGGLLAPTFNRPMYGPIYGPPVPYPVPVYQYPVNNNSYQIYY